MLGVAAPVRDAPVDAGAFLHGACSERVEGPDLLARGGVEGKHFCHGRGGVEDGVDDDGVALDLGAALRRSVAGVVGPGYLQLIDVGAVDLVEG